MASLSVNVEAYRFAKGAPALPRHEVSHLVAVSSYAVRDVERGIRIRLLGGDVPGGDFKGPGGRINWLLEYTRGDLLIEVPCYSASSSFSFEHDGSTVERSYDRAYALPVDIIRETFKIKYVSFFNSLPREEEVEGFVRDLAETLFILSRPMAEAMHKWLGKELDLQVLRFEAYPGGPLPLTIDWAHVGNAAKAALAASEREA